MSETKVMVLASLFSLYALFFLFQAGETYDLRRIAYS
jgi:hypothetical protein